MLSANYYVDAAGLGGTPSDNNPGTIDRPLATYREALDRAGPGDTIYLRGGTYSESNGNGSIGFSASGLPGAPLTIKAYPGEQPIIDLGEQVHWQTDSHGWKYADLSAPELAALSSPVMVQIRNGWTASAIVGASVNGGPAQDFQQPPSAFMLNGQLAYDLTWYDSANMRLWFRSNTMEPVTDPDTQCAVISPYSQFHMNSGSWVTIDGLQFQHGYTALHVESQGHLVVKNCRIVHCAGQGILGGGDYSEIANNYIDMLGGQLVYRSGGIQREQLNHCFYFTTNGGSIHDNFFGRALAGYSAQIIVHEGVPTTIHDNVMYGSYGDGMTLYAASDSIVTGNAFITHPAIWRGTLLATTGSGMRSYFSDPDITISGNYIEGAAEGFVLFSSLGQQTIPGMVITGNTSVGGVYAGEIDGIPEAMDRNHWAGANQMAEFYPHIVTVADYLTWAQARGFESQSGYHTASLIDPFAYDSQLNANPALATAMSLFRQYAASQVNTIAGLPAGTATTIGGNSTPDTAGITPTAADDAYSLAAGSTLTVAAGQSVLVNDSDPNGSSLTANWLSGPAHGSLALHLDGTFTYTPATGFYGGDQFVYQVHDKRGGMAQAMVSLSISGALAAANDTYALDTTSTLTVLAPGVLANDTTRDGENVTISADPPQHGVLAMHADGSFDYTPTSGYVGSDIFTYTISRQNGDNATATVSLNVRSAEIGVTTGSSDNDTFRLWRDSADQGPFEAMATHQGLALTYSVASNDFATWSVYGLNGMDTLKVDYLHGDPLPSSGVYFDGGTTVDDGTGLIGDQLAVLNSDPSVNIYASGGAFRVGSGAPIHYVNVEKYYLGRFAVPGFLWWPGQTIMFGQGSLVLPNGNPYVGDLDSGSGTMRVDGTALLKFLWVEGASRLAGSGVINFSQDGFYLYGLPGGIYYTTTSTSTFAGTIAGPGIVEVDNGSLTLSGVNTYTGKTSLNGGILLLGNANAAQNSTVSVNNSLGMGFVAGLGTANLGGLTGSGNLVLQDSAATPAPVTLAVGGNGESTSYTGALSGTGGLTKNGFGVLTLMGPNTYGGSTLINAGALKLGNNNSLQNSTVTIGVDQGLTFAAGLGSANLGGLSGSGNLALQDLGTTPAAIGLAVGSNNANTSYSGRLIGPGSLTKKGSGSLTLSGNNTYTGGTTVQGGTLRIAAPQALPDNRAITVKAGAKLVFGQDAVPDLAAAHDVVLASM